MTEEEKKRTYKSNDQNYLYGIELIFASLLKLAIEPILCFSLLLLCHRRCVVVIVCYLIFKVQIFSSSLFRSGSVVMKRYFDSKIKTITIASMENGSVRASAHIWQSMCVCLCKKAQCNNNTSNEKSLVDWHSQSIDPSANIVWLFICVCFFARIHTRQWRYDSERTPTLRTYTQAHQSLFHHWLSKLICASSRESHRMRSIKWMLRDFHLFQLSQL